MKTDHSQSCGHCWVFQICWHTECSTFTESSFRIWNSSPGIPSPPLALFVVMLPKAHLASHSRMSGSRWMIIPSWLSELWRSFLHSSSVYFCPLFLICPLLSPILHEMFPCYLWFSWDLLSFPFYCFPLFLCTDHWGRFSYLTLLFFGTLYSDGYIFPFLLCLSLLFFSQLFVSPPQTIILPSWISFSWGSFWSPPPVQYFKPPSKVL